MHVPLHPTSTSNTPSSPVSKSAQAEGVSVTHRLIWIGAVSILLYSGLAWLYPLWEGLHKPLRTWAGLVQANGIIGGLHAFTYIALMALYVLGLKVMRRLSGPSQRVTLVVLAVWLMSISAMAFSYPGESQDIFDYIFRGRMYRLYGRSPLDTTPFELQDKPFARYVSWAKWVDAYGPIWEYASGNIAALTQTTANNAETSVRVNSTCRQQPSVCSLLLKHVLAYRLFSVLCASLCGALIYALVKHHSPADALAALMAWLWNPLLLIAAGAGGHNETLVILPVLLMLWLMQRHQWLGGLLCLFAAVHIKLTCLIFLPPVCLWLFARLGWKATLLRLSIFAALAAPLSWLLYEPLGGWETLQRNLYERSIFSANSISNVIYWLLREWAMWERYDAQRTVARYAPLTFAVVAGVWLWRWWRGRTHTDATLWQALATVATLYFLVGSYWFQYWYLLWLAALVGMFPRSAWASKFLPAYGLGGLLATHTLDFLTQQQTFPAPTPALASVLYVTILLLPLVLAATGSRLISPPHAKSP